MRMCWVWGPALAVGVWGCSSAHVTQPPAPPESAELEDAVRLNFEPTDAGQPILFSVPDTVIPGWEVLLIYDQTLDDPTTRWGECLARIGACYDTNAGYPIAGCIDLITKCADDSGGTDCCPPGCVAQFKTLLKSGASEHDAIAGSFVKGSCVVGFDDSVQP
jgi:hypothetical protein